MDDCQKRLVVLLNELLLLLLLLLLLVLSILDEPSAPSLDWDE